MQNKRTVPVAYRSNTTIAYHNLGIGQGFAGDGIFDLAFDYDAGAQRTGHSQKQN